MAKFSNQRYIEKRAFPSRPPTISKPKAPKMKTAPVARITRPPTSLPSRRKGLPSPLVRPLKGIYGGHKYL